MVGLKPNTIFLANDRHELKLVAMVISEMGTIWNRD